MGIDRARFFPGARASVFHGVMTQSQVDGLNAILDAYEASHVVSPDYRDLSYMLATAYHETAATMQPIAEYGKGHGHPYGEPINGHVYYGRGYVQLTWLANYRALSPIVGADLVADPDLALRPDIAAKVMFIGMETGLFTGKKLADYITPKSTDFLHCRCIINGTDHAAQIAAYAHDFLIAI